MKSEGAVGHVYVNSRVPAFDLIESMPASDKVTAVLNMIKFSDK